jgi:hypothetical protein
VEVSFTAELWRYDGEGGWHFVTLPPDLAADIRDRVPRHGFGSVRVTAAVGDVRWDTSLFPESRTGSFVLPVKQQVRRANDLEAGDPVDVRLTLRA